MAPLFERLASQIALALSEQIEEHDGCRDLFRQKLDPRRGRVKAELECVEIEAPIIGDDDFAIEHATGRQLRLQRLEKLWKVAVQGLCIAALDLDFVAVAEDQCPKTIPLRFKNPCSGGG